MLSVPQGARGLRPGDAVFGHVKNLPDLVEEVMADADPDHLVGVAVSVAPRPREGSYLPSFLSGEAVARSLAALAHVSLLRTTHQEGHIRAGMAGVGMVMDRPFYAFHASGGTTELLRVVPHDNGFGIETAAGTDDLYAGQLVDRIGVRLGLSFPAGPELDRLAESTQDVHAIPFSRPRWRDGRWWSSFSGPESAAQRALDSGAAPAAVARGVMESVAQSLAAVVKTVGAEERDLLLVGGVAANTYLRRRLRELLADDGWTVWFADPEWSRDNAIGVAHLGLDAWKRQREDV